jgi:3-oxoacyl-ACP reductase-like protein
VPLLSAAVTTKEVMKKLKRSKLKQICELAADKQKYILAQQKQMESLNEELTQTFKQHLEHILSLTTKVNFQKAKGQQTDDTLKNFAADREKLNETVEHVRKSVTASQQHIASLLMQNEALAKEAREAHRVAVREGVEQATSDLPKEIDAASQCGHFELDCHSIKRLRQIEDNNPRTVGVSIPKHFQCQT